LLGPQALLGAPVSFANSRETTNGEPGDAAPDRCTWRPRLASAMTSARHGCPNPTGLSDPSSRAARWVPRHRTRAVGQPDRVLNTARRRCRPVPIVAVARSAPPSVTIPRDGGALARADGTHGRSRRAHRASERELIPVSYATSARRRLAPSDVPSLVTDPLSIHHPARGSCGGVGASLGPAIAAGQWVFSGLGTGARQRADAARQIHLPTAESRAPRH
jgi:hypothetical protein